MDDYFKQNSLKCEYAFIKFGLNSGSNNSIPQSCYKGEYFHFIIGQKIRNKYTYYIEKKTQTI